MKKHLILIAVMLAAILPTFGQDNRPGGYDATAFKLSNFVQTIIIEDDDYTIPSPLVVEVWNNGVKLSDSTDVTVSGDTIRFTLTPGQLAPLVKTPFIYLKDGDATTDPYILGIAVTVKSGYASPIGADKKVYIKSMGNIRIVTGENTTAAISAANRASAQVPLAITARNEARAAKDSAIATLASRYRYGSPPTLRSLSESMSSYLVVNGNASGVYIYDASDTTTPDDTINTIVRSDNKRYKFLQDGPVNVKRYGVTGNGVTDDTQAIQKAILKNNGGVLYFPPGTYLADNIQNNSVSIIGAGSKITILKVKSDSACFFKLGYDVPLFRHKEIADVTIEGTNRARNGLKFESGSFTDISGRWVINRVIIQNCNKGIFKPTGNIGNSFNYCLFNLNNYGYFALGINSPIMHAGYDSFFKTTFSGSYKAGAYINSITSGTGLTTFDNSHFEANIGFGLFVDEYATGYVAFSLINCWFEANASGGTVDIQGTDYAPLDAYIKNATNVVMQGTHVSKMEVKNSSISLYSCYITNQAFQAYDSLSTVNIYDSVSEGYEGNYITSSVKDQLKNLSGTAGVFLAEKPKIIKSRGVAKTAISYSDFKVYSMHGSGTINSTPVLDNYIFPVASEFTVPAGAQQLVGTTSLTNGKFYVLTVSLKHISGPLPASINWNYDYFNSGQIKPILKNHWRTFSVIGKCTASGTSATFYIANNAGGATDWVFRIQGLQVVEFSTEQAAIQYYNDNILATDKPLEAYAASAPASGAWVIGDRVINSSPAVGQPKSWKCTVSGSPGTWVSEGTL